MRFTSLHLSNFRGTRELEIGFEPDVTVIVGRNGAGKTSILDALAITICSVRSHFKDFNERDVNVRFYAQDVAEGADSAKLEIEFVVGDHQSDRAVPTNRLVVGVDKYEGQSETHFEGKGQALFVHAPSECRLVYYRQERGFSAARKGAAREASADLLDPEVVQDRSLQRDLRAIEDLAAWWDQRDAQEARRVRDGERDFRDPELESIRALVGKIDSFDGMTFDSTASPPGLYFIKKSGAPVHVSGLSGGERSYIVLLADLARRLQVFAPGKPLNEISAIVLIDEIELNLHPGWQSEIVPTLTDVFQACQFVVTTHSPQVLSGVDSGKVRVIEVNVPDWSSKVTVPLSTRGRTSNYLLEGVLGAKERYPPIDRLINDFNTAVDREDIAEATETLAQIERQIDDDIPTLLVLRKRLKKLRGNE